LYADTLDTIVFCCGVFVRSGWSWRCERIFGFAGDFVNDSSAHEARGFDTELGG
jgi:hypothetical protein